MNDKELADRCVALGVGKRTKHKAAYHKWFLYDALEDEQFVRDWRVAGSLMEKVKDGGAWFHDKNKGWCAIHEASRAENAYYAGWENASGESLPRTIIEACCEALND